MSYHGHCDGLGPQRHPHGVHLCIAPCYPGHGPGRPRPDPLSPTAEGRSCVTLGRSCASWRWTLSKRWAWPPPRPGWSRATSCPTARSSPSARSISTAQRCSSRHPPSISTVLQHLRDHLQLHQDVDIWKDPNANTVLSGAPPCTPASQTPRAGDHGPDAQHQEDQELSVCA